MIINQVVAGSGGGGTPQGIYRAYTIDGTGDLAPSTTADYSQIDLSNLTHLSWGYCFFKAFSGNTTITSVDLSNFNCTDYGVSERAFQVAFQNCTSITSVDLSSLVTTYSNQYLFCAAFDGCTNLTTINLNSLHDVSGNYAFSSAFANTGVVSVSLPNFEYATNNYSFSNAFKNCSALVSVHMPKYTTAGTSHVLFGTFMGTALPTMKFESLTGVSGDTALGEIFKNCTSLQSVWFYALTTTSFGSKTNQFNDMLSGVTGCTVHFPMAIQSTIGSWSSVTGGFGGTNTTVSFDLVTSLTGADSNTYTRSEKDSTSTATAWSYNDTLYYTSGVSDNTNGVNEPSVGDTIYSDDACTTAVTTISAIA